MYTTPSQHERPNGVWMRRHYNADTCNNHDDVIKWKHFPRYWPFVRGIHRSPVNSPHKGQWRGALMFSLIYARINGWVNNREAVDMRRHQAHCGVIVMTAFTYFNMLIKIMKKNNDSRDKNEIATSWKTWVLVYINSYYQYMVTPYREKIFSIRSNVQTNLFRIDLSKSGPVAYASFTPTRLCIVQATERHTGSCFCQNLQSEIQYGAIKTRSIFSKLLIKKTTS